MIDLITPDMMREAMRARIAAGVDRHSISHLICLFAKPSPSEKPRIDGRVLRLPVERIPEQERAAFLSALEKQRPLDTTTGWLPGLPVQRVPTREAAG